MEDVAMARQIPICDDDGLVMAVMELEDEGLDNKNNPATITVYTLNGNISAQVKAEVGGIKGADGDMYPRVEFTEDVEFVKDEAGDSEATSETAFTEGEI